MGALVCDSGVFHFRFCTEKKRRFGWCIRPKEIIFFFSSRGAFCVPFRMKGPVEPPTAAHCRCKIGPIFGSVMDDLERNYSSTSWVQNPRCLRLFFVVSLSLYRWAVRGVHRKPGVSQRCPLGVFLVTVCLCLSKSTQWVARETPVVNSPDLPIDSSTFYAADALSALSCFRVIPTAAAHSLASWS